jgi:hypothetical protein
MYWNYRIIKSIDKNGEPFFGIHEVYYDDNNVPKSCTAEPTSLISESVEGLKADLNLIAKVFDKPVLEMLYFDKLSEESEI